jgi:trans-aconitate methyltransferase
LSASKTISPNSKQWFDSVGEEGLRGLQGQAGCIHYANYILEAIKPRYAARVVDLGCGDGGVCTAIAQMRPDLEIHGWDFSDELIGRARMNAVDIPNLEFECVELKSALPDSAPVDYFFSFSVIQYFSVQDFTTLNVELKKRLAEGGLISHLSIPDLVKRPLLFHADWLDHSNHSSLSAACNIIKMIAVDTKRRITGDRRYGNSLFHDAAELARSAPRELTAKISRPSDSWYRFDLHLH